MRKNLILAISAIAMAASITSCTNNDTPSEVSEYITIDAGVGSLIRATSTAFEADDAVSIYAWTGSTTAVQTPLVVNNSVNTYDGTKWTAVPQMLWKDQITAHYFIGVYPMKEISDFTADSYATTPDLLVATVLGSGRVATDGIVPMVFDHVMAKLMVNLTFRTEFGATTPTVESVTVNAQPEAVVNYLTKVATADGTATEVAMTATTANTAYSQIVSPQSIHKITINIGGKAYVYNNTAGFALAGGKIQTVNLIVGRDEITLGSVTINDWGTGETIDDGEAMN
ncbi:fimbrillin family protein [Bacteroides sp.]|uniref:fimbrillin family protein n=1 Tax=Bacteroides sp. TaxID=29523 RepID=UPI0026285E82|nr:fimbrillin family protein [Bacteroides sp.]MDD3036937.1 fimbrillin family protein [Bacteroides sp.]